VLFQVVDDKSECTTVFIGGQFKDAHDSADLTRTWKYTGHFQNSDNIEYAQLYCAGQGLDEVCPAHLRDEWTVLNKKMKAFLRSFHEAKISLQDNCYFDLVPKAVLVEYLDMKNEITEHVLTSYEKPQDYDFLLSLSQLVSDVGQRELNLNQGFKRSDLSLDKMRRFNNKFSKIQPCVRYNIFGTKTGRLTTAKGYFPILNFDKDFRHIIEPVNELFLELDYNATELRVLLALLSKEQPLEDLHEWNAKHIYQNLQSREEAKKRIFAWLYNPESKDHLSGRFYDRDKLKAEYYKDGRVVNPYGREIGSDAHHAVNYLIQSTASDLFLRQAVKLYDFLRDKKSFISFMIHDSMVLDMSVEDKKHIEEIVGIFQQTEFGNFKTNVKLGKNFGTMNEVNL
tara:strand:- start:97 stop:1287 length:1191 start_codon:yes stop_codon:yes gene_type:complete